MNFDLTKIQESKRAFRQHLAARPIAEKLAMLDHLRERQLALQGRTPSLENRPATLSEQSPPYSDRCQTMFELYQQPTSDPSPAAHYRPQTSHFQHLIVSRSPRTLQKRVSPALQGRDNPAQGKVPPGGTASLSTLFMTA